MINAAYHWELAPAIPLEEMEKFGMFPRVQQRLLYNRGIRDSEVAYRYLRQQGSLYDPFLLDGMAAAVERIFHMIRNGEKIAVYGDYDVDGVTASALLIQVLRLLGADVCSYIPNRFEEGYGVNQEAIRTLAKAGISLTITVDCGIRSPQEVELANSLGMNMIVTDHHEPGDVIPAAAAVVSPRKPGDCYPEKNLAGVGLAFKVAEALLTQVPELGISPEKWLDLVAIGTVADIVPLTNENRSLVRGGLARLRVSDRPGIIALAEVSGTKLTDIRASTIGYYFGPRLNAAGRLETARLAFDLLMAETLAEARAIAVQLNDQNRQRQTLTREMQERISVRIDTDDIPMVITAYDTAFNMGVVGLAASRLTDQFYRPAIVGALDGGMIRASCRSIPEFHINAALDTCADLMERHGGHAMAAGLTIRQENWDELVRRLRVIAAEQLDGMDLKPTRKADLEISLNYLQEPLLDQLTEMEPFGEANPEPVFIVRGLKILSARKMGKERNHLKLMLQSDDQIAIEGVAFGRGDCCEDLPERIDVLGTLEMNTFNHISTLQLRLIDFQAAEEA